MILIESTDRNVEWKNQNPCIEDKTILVWRQYLMRALVSASYVFDSVRWLIDLHLQLNLGILRCLDIRPAILRLKYFAPCVINQSSTGGVATNTGSCVLMNVMINFHPSRRWLVYEFSRQSTLFADCTSNTSLFCLNNLPINKINEKWIPNLVSQKIGRSGKKMIIKKTVHSKNSKVTSS